MFRLSFPRLALGVLLAACCCGRASAAATRVERIQYESYAAYRLTDGKTEAVAVPAIGRIMRYGRVGGPNLLWNSPDKTWPAGAWRNYGGEKNWLAPQSSWKQFHGSNIWPPDPAFDGRSYSCRILPGRKLQMTSTLSPGTGIRFVRTMWIAPDGDFVINEKASKSSGPAIDASIWSVTQAIPGDLIVLPVNPNGAYQGGYANIQETLPAGAARIVDRDLLFVTPKPQDGSKIGVTPTVAVAAVASGRTAFVLSASAPRGKYPDGMNGPGFPLELYINNDPKRFYCEMELLGPITHAAGKVDWSQTLRWSVHTLPPGGAGSRAVEHSLHALIYRQRP